MSNSGKNPDLPKMMEVLGEVIREQGWKPAQIQRALGWKRPRLTDLQAYPSRLGVEELLQILEVVKADPLEFMERVYGKTADSERMEEVRQELESMLERLNALAVELREGPQAAGLVVWAARSLLRPLAGALRGGASADRVEKALVETLGVALAVCEQGMWDGEG